MRSVNTPTKVNILAYTGKGEAKAGKGDNELAERAGGQKRK